MSLGQAIGGVVGAVGGFLAAGPLGLGAATSALYGAQIGMTIGGIIDPISQQNYSYGPRLSDLSQQTSTYGAVVPRVYGTFPITGNVFWLENNQLKETATVTETESGGKGGTSSSSSNTTYSYSATFAVGICEGPIIGVRKIWIGPNLIYDAGSSDAETLAASNKAVRGLTIYTGTDTQVANTRMQATLGVANVPAYTGLAYIVFEDFELADYGNSLAMAQVKVEVSTAAAVEKVASDVTFPQSRYWQKALWSGESFVVAGQNTNYTGLYDYGPMQMLRSTNGVDYTYNETSFSLGSLISSMFSNGQGVLIASGESLSSDNILAFSDDYGNTWNSYSYSYSSPMVSISYDGTIYCAFYGEFNLGNQYLTSYDGIVWTERTTLPSSSHWLAATYFDGKFYVVSDSGNYASSTDGISWTQYSIGFNGGTGITSDENGLCIWNSFDSQYPILISSDGLNWNSPTAQFEITPASNLVILDSIYYICVYDAEFNLKLAYSSDAENWTYIDILTDVPVFYSFFYLAASDYEVLVVSSNVYPSDESTRAAVVYDTITTTAATNTNLGAIVSSEVIKSNLLGLSDIDTDDLTDEVYGYGITSASQIKGNLQPLMSSWPFDVVNHGYSLKFVRRGGISVASISSEDLDARDFGQSVGVEFQTSREMDSQLPKKISINFLDYNREYDIGEQYQERLNTDAINEVIIDLPIAMSSNEALQKAEILLYAAWLGRYDVGPLRLPPTYNNLEPADIVTLTVNNTTYELRITSINYNANGVIDVIAKYNSSSVYSSAAVGEDGQSTGSSIKTNGVSTYELLDVPLLSNSMDTPGFMGIMSSTYSAWPGGSIYRVEDSGQSFVIAKSFLPPAAIVGYVIGTLGEHDGYLIDKSGSITVYLSNGTLSSVTEESILNGNNYFAYGVNGRYEIIAAQNCVEQVDGSYVLTDFLRGRFGTEWTTGIHEERDTIVYLSDSYLRFINVDSAYIGTVKKYRCITSGDSLSSGLITDKTFTYNGVNLKPLSPVYLNGNIDSSDNWTLTWTRRARVSGEWRDYVDVPVGEETESYEIDIYDDSGYSNVLRTLTSSEESVSYTSAEQVEDFGGNQTTLYIKVYQMSATIGRGYALTDSITR